jgi:hypothetical protein
VSSINACAGLSRRRQVNLKKINLVLDAWEFASPSVTIWEWSNAQNDLAIQTNAAS